MDPVAFRLPFIGLPIYWYGVIVVICILVGAFVTSIEASRRGENPDHIWNGLILVIIFGLIGARLYHVISSPQGLVRGFDYYLQHPVEIFMIRQGGLGIFGAIAGGVLAVYIYARWQKLNFLTWIDIAAPGLALGQAIGRWGNFFNQELYGYPTTVPWGIPIDLRFRLPQFANLPETTRFHPTFLYESLWSLVAFVILMYVARRFGDRLLKGDVFLVYCILYPLGRFLVELQRPDAWMLGPLAAAQAISLLIMLAAVAILVYRHRRRSAAEAQPVDTSVDG
ncbi:MAG TPA: prolipoprotein diacylglyceryl transferase [Anaerolineae bacterium]|nr:prolipoprotein diacylglyceryl transferase [Anaerolineae bacterium]